MIMGDNNEGKIDEMTRQYILYVHYIQYVQFAYIRSPDVLSHLKDLRSSIYWSISDIEVDDERHCTNTADALGYIEREGATLIGSDVVETCYTTSSRSSSSSSRSSCRSTGCSRFLMIDEQVIRKVS